MYVVPSIKVAEMSERMLCEELGLDFEKVREACNTKWNIEILEARDGIKGHAYLKILKILCFCLSLAKGANSLLKGAIKTDEKYRQWVKKLGEDRVVR